MYGFDNETFLSVLHGAVDNIETIGKVLDQAEKRDTRTCFSSVPAVLIRC